MFKTRAAFVLRVEEINLKCLIELIISLIMQIFNIHKQIYLIDKNNGLEWVRLFIKESSDWPKEMNHLIVFA